jgi:hypothetical protein
MNRDEILDAARDCVSVSRAATYGDAAANFANIAMLWQAYIDMLGGKGLTRHDIGPMLALFKIARHQANPSHVDSMVDACGYLALAGELSTHVDMV